MADSVYFFNGLVRSLDFYALSCYNLSVSSLALQLRYGQLDPYLCHTIPSVVITGLGCSFCPELQTSRGSDLLVKHIGPDTPNTRPSPREKLQVSPYKNSVSRRFD
ncbi:hypothetical protein BaRGS_00037937 [Batillaria attramentaria]|uniref:Uncharacterized protein n=1 Tax=Batillaria attramentaria TaxID=370345 RepID=A0ABD0J7J7_9CAEN